jgi:hypothetical protein
MDVGTVLVVRGAAGDENVVLGAGDDVGGVPDEVDEHALSASATTAAAARTR